MMKASSRILYIKGEKNKELTKTDVLLGDILSMECADQAVVNRMKTVRLFREHPKAGMWFPFWK